MLNQLLERPVLFGRAAATSVAVLRADNNIKCCMYSDADDVEVVMGIRLKQVIVFVLSWMLV